MLDRILVVNPEENYWLFRAGNGAEYFSEFYSLNKIGMAWDKLETLGQLNSKEVIADEVKRLYPENTSPWTISSKIYKFVHDIKVGDIVVMPDENKKQIAFGKIISNDTTIKTGEDRDMTVDNGNTDGSISGFINKYRAVKWIKLVPGEELSPSLKQYLNSPHTISSLKNNSIYEINKVLNDVFILNEKLYIRYKVLTKKSVYAKDMGLFFNLISYAEEIATLIKGEEVKIETKTNVSSPGDIVAIGVVCTTVLGILASIVTGGKIEVEGEFKGSKVKFCLGGGKSLFDWLIENKKLNLEEKDKIVTLNKIIEKINHQHTPEEIEKMVENLELISPEELNLEKKDF